MSFPKLMPWYHGTKRNGTGRNEEGAKMLSDANKEEGDGEMWNESFQGVRRNENSSRGIVCSTRFMRTKRETERFVPFCFIHFHVPNGT
ncbi:hypothetical protein DVH24_017485 [Malus domestica]|uniref:Uncharacterized protein n=1 Tax=Malus domestica TaxID=3750 RepID=A0A498IXL6_MALDO|nr:hypothetical protein DVH24_017485 [Malus domestica]